jgi:uncharacterized membrane protein YkoI
MKAVLRPFALSAIILGSTVLLTVASSCNTASGDVVSNENNQDRGRRGRDRGSDDSNNANSNLNSNSRNTDLRISEVRARTIALEEVPGRIIKLEFGDRRGRGVYEIYIRNRSGNVYELHVDANSGEVLKVEREG